MKPRCQIPTYLLALTLAAPAASGLELTKGLDLTPYAQYRLRYYHREGKDFAPGGVTDTFRHRARLGLGLTYDNLVGVKVVAQDVRTFGEETDTLQDAKGDGIDVHEAYLRVLPAKALELRLGRQEIAFANHRLIGTVEFLEQARAFDAFRATYTDAEIKLDAFYAHTFERGGANPAQTAAADDVFGLYGHYSFAPEATLALMLVGDLDASTERNRFTTGWLFSGTTEFGLGYTVEGYFQSGSAEAAKYEAWMAGATIRYTLPVTASPFIENTFEFLSGDRNPDDKNEHTFDTLYATGHKFHGEFDRFLNIPVDTAKRGLMDLAVTLGVAPVKELNLSAAVHHFRPFYTRADENARGCFGTELDVRAAYQPIKYLSLDVVYSFYAPGLLYPDDALIEHFVYTTATGSF